MEKAWYSTSNKNKNIYQYISLTIMYGEMILAGADMRPLSHLGPPIETIDDHESNDLSADIWWPYFFLWPWSGDRTFTDCNCNNY